MDTDGTDVSNTHKLVHLSERSQRLIGLLTVFLSLAYLLLFVRRGWVSHDEGMIGQSAERVLLGGIPHVDYEESYTGGLSWAYAAVFKAKGVDLVNPRWLLFAGASLAQLAMFSLLRRYLSPVVAALVAWAGLAWSFPNFFAGLPSWWVLILAICCLWAFVRLVETRKLQYAAVAGLVAGLAVAVKQTGVYLLVALVMSLVYTGDWSGSAERENSSKSLVEQLVRAAAATGALLLAIGILSSRLALAEMLYLLLPIAACSRVLIAGDRRSEASAWRVRLLAAMVAVGGAALPLACFAGPYVIHHQLGRLVNGLFVLPQKRLVFAGMEMPPAQWILTGVPLVGLLLPASQDRLSRAGGRLLGAASWIVALALAIGSLYNVTSYQIVWQSSRAVAALLPIAIGWALLSGRVREANQRRILFACSAMLAWAALVQFPFGAPVYFCYIAPLALIAGTAMAQDRAGLGGSALGAWVGMLLVFAVLSMNRGYIYNLGQRHEPQALNVPLDLPRAHLNVSGEDAATYQKVVALIANHIGDGRLFAGPDCPEVYFLTGRFNPSGILFDFFSEESSHASNRGAWADARVVVLNHRPGFSPRPSWQSASEIRREFPEGEFIGQFEVRWR